MASANATPFPQAFGRYILTQKIAMGGMAEIFRAKSLGAEGFEKVVVIKRILPHFSEDEGFVTMFKDEARVAAHLSHANVVQIFDFAEADGLFYIAMEYVEGRDLKRVLDQGALQERPLSIAQTVHILIEAALGLHYAHTRIVDGEPLHIVHRDVSPHNVMISFAGEVKIMDFGIAKAASRSTKTRVGTVKGKCAYMSPEQARGKPLDARSDLFALAVVLWEMLTGKRLFVGDSDFETLNNVLKAEIPAPSELNPEVPAELDAIVQKALSRDRDERYADCGAFAGELRRWYYATVSDPEAASLKGYLHSLFAEEIAQIRTDAAAELAMMEQVRRGALPGFGAAGSGSGSGPKRAVTGSQPATPSMPDERTVALDAAPSEHTLALPDGLAAAGRRGSASEEAPAGTSRAGWYLGVGLAAAAFAAIAVLASGGVAKGEKGAGEPSAGIAVVPKVRKVGIHIRAAGAQQILVDDNPICTEPNCDFGGEQGSTIKILARAGERMKIVYHKLETDDEVVEVKLPELATPVAAAAGPVVVVHVEPGHAIVTVNSRPLELHGGNGKLEAAKLGDTLHVEAKADGFKPATRDFIVQNAQLETFVVSMEKDQDKHAVGSHVAVAAPGKIVVTAQPWANVAVKGKDLGLTPVKAELPAGKYTLTLTKGAKSKSIGVVVKAGQTATVNVDMRSE